MIELQLMILQYSLTIDTDIRPFPPLMSLALNSHPKGLPEAYSEVI